MRKCRIVGVDLGGCAGDKTAIVVLEGEDVLEAYRLKKARSYEQCNDELKYEILRYQPDYIGIDAPLSIPRKLYDPTFKSLLEEIEEGEITNPYLYRETEYFIFKVFGLRPMPPVGDRIGRITARALHFLHEFGRERVFELYPAQIKERYSTIKDFNKDPHICDAYAVALGVQKILQGYTIYPAGDLFQEGWIWPVL